MNCFLEERNTIYKYLLKGAKLLSTSYSDFYISQEGPKLDTGSFTKMFEILGKEQATIFGKPSPMLYEVAMLDTVANDKRKIAYTELK